MNKNLLLLWSFGAAVIIILASLGSVVGFQSVKSSAEQDVVSPIFGVRAQKAIDKEESKVMTTSEYIGKGKDNIPLPKLEKDVYALLKNYDFLPDVAEVTTNIICLILLILLFPIWFPVVCIEILRTMLNIDTCYYGTCGFTCRPTYCDNNCAAGYNNEILNTIQQKIQNNPLFQKLILDHPELVSEIAQLNS